MKEHFAIIPPRLLRLLPLLAALACGASLILAAAPSAPPAPRITSELWGARGELWTPASRLPDFSFAGYRSAAAPLPRPPVVADVRKFGAIGDGTTDDTAAFEAAIARATKGAVLIPPGRYRITRPLYLRKSQLVLRGAGPKLTTLVFPKHLTEVLGPPKGGPGLESWSWGGGFLWVEGRERGTRLAGITAPADRGSSTLRLSSTSGLAVGQSIRLAMTDPDGSLGRHLHADQLDAHRSLVGRRLVRFPAKIAAIDGDTITLDRPLRLDVRTAWRPEILSSTGRLEEVGLEGFTLEFPAVPYRGHYREPGYNGIWMDGVTHSWIRDIAVRNGDSGILLERASFCTVADVSLTADPATRQHARGTFHSGHHGIQLRRSDDCLVRDFTISTRFHHDLTVEDATGCVFMKGRGLDLNFDHHTYLPYENLFTQLDLGLGSRHFASSGSRYPESAARETLWNIKSARPATILPNPSPTRGRWPQPNFIGLTTTLPTTRDPAQAWVEAIDPARLHPPNLYEAQLARRLAPPPVNPRRAAWDGGSPATPGAQGGSGEWRHTGAANWWQDSSHRPWPAAGSADHAHFAGEPGTVTVDPAGVVAHALTIASSGYRFIGGPLVLNGSSPTIATHAPCEVESPLAGPSGLTKTGKATLHLRAANRYQGDTRVHQGTLLIGRADHRLPASTRLILGDGPHSGIFQMNSRSQQVAGLRSSGHGKDNRVINSSASAPVFTVHLANATDRDFFAGSLGGPGRHDNHYHFTKSGPGHLILTGPSTYTGTTTILDGTLQIGDDGPAGTLAPGPITNHGTLRFDRRGTLVVANPIHGRGSLLIDCPPRAGTIQLRGDNRFQGDITIASGTLAITRASALGSGPKTIDLTRGHGTLRLDGDGIELPATFTLRTSGSPAPGAIHHPAGRNTIAGPIQLGIGAGNTLITSDCGSLTLAGPIIAPGASRTLVVGGRSTGDNRVIGPITETAGRILSVEKTGPGTWTLAGSNTHTGTTTVNAGRLVLTGSLAGPLAVAHGTLAPQGHPISRSSLNLQPKGRFEARPGDTLTLATNVTLAGQLDLVAPPGLPAGSRHTILRKSSAGAIRGTFTGKPEGAIFPASGYQWRISYLGGDGNDVVLTVLPENAIGH
jgi:autotransporter-associated beta strand protein